MVENLDERIDFLKDSGKSIKSDNIEDVDDVGLHCVSGTTLLLLFLGGMVSSAIISSAVYGAVKLYDCIKNLYR